MKYFLKVFLIFFIIFSVILGAGFAWYIEKDDQEKKIENEEKKIEELTVKEEKKDRVNILLLGIDALDGNYEGNKSRTDTMMVLSIDPKSNTAFILSVPRDSRVKIRGRKGLDRANHAHAYGGVDLSLKTVKDLLQIPIHHYIRVDYKALFKTIDDIGGIEIDVPMDMYWSDPYATPPLLINLKKGRQMLDGQKSMEYLRFRHGYANQDLGRINAQQEFIQKVLEKVLSPSSVMNIPNYIETMSMYVDTDMSKKDMLDLGKDVIKLDPSKLEKHMIPGKPQTINGVSYYVLDEEKMMEMVNYLMSGNYAPEETTTPEATSSDNSAQNKSSEGTTSTIKTTGENKTPVEVVEKAKKIYIQNGSGIGGIAKRASDLLKIANIEVTGTGNAKNFDYEQTMIYYGSDSKTAEEIKKALGKGKVTKDQDLVDSAKTDILIIIGQDF